MPQFLTINKNEISGWLCSFGILSLCFSPLMFFFVWGNHDWLPILNDAGVNGGIIEGRFSQYLLLNIFLSGKILPIFNILFGIGLYALALVLLCTRFFDFPLTTLSDKLFLVTIAALPYINEIFYFHFITFSLLGWSLVITLSLIAAKLATANHPVAYTLLSTILLFTAVGGYPASISMFAVGACLFAIYHPDIKRLIPFVVSFILALAPIPFIYNWLKQKGLMISLYNSQTESLANLIRKIPETLSLSLENLYQPQPFFPLGFKILVSTIILLFCICLNKEYYKKHKLYLGLLFIPVLLLALKLPLWLSHQDPAGYYTTRDPVAFMVRGDFYAVPVLLLFSLFYLKKFCSLRFRNFLFILSAALLWFCINLNLSFCKTLLLGFRAENFLIQRITDRIQQHPDYNSNTIYNISQTGEVYFRRKYHTPTENEKYGFYTWQTPFGRYWTAGETFNFYAPQNFAANHTPISLEYITKKMIDFAESPTAVWPAPNAIYFDNNYCIIALTAEGKQPLIQQFNYIKERMQ